MFRVRDFKKFILYSFILFIGLNLAYFIFLNKTYREISNEIYNKNAAIAGSILRDHRELEEDVVKNISKSIDSDDVKLGTEILDKYSYTESPDDQNVLKSIYKDSILKTFLISLGGYLLLLSIYFLYQKSLEKKLISIYTEAEKVINGNYRVQLDESGDGLIDILNHQFNKMVRIIRSNSSDLVREKIFLKNTMQDISHQLKTPLSSLIMFNDIMLDDENMPWELRSDFLEKSQEQFERMQWLIINLLNLARIEADAIDFKREDYKVYDLCKAAKKTLEANFQKKNLSFKISGPEDATFFVDWDWTVEAIINILKNATEYSPENKTIECNITNNEASTTLSIINFGEKIELEDPNLIFRRFFRQKEGDSVGIGLNMTKSIIEAQKGLIDVTNVENGVKFDIVFLKTR
ncbi:sensor histidine kinase [Citroniella saccharovorans]|uniref:sensor histidine kinase n=1 Tax=Citroniella saccharovorans TaxID=2053367 RepID=UPI0036073578